MASPSSVTTTFANGPQKACAVCAALMPAQAIKCTVCDSFQNWRQYLSFPQLPTILALLTALASVIASSTPTFIGLFGGEYSNLEVRFDRDDHAGGIILSVYNGGNRGGGIKDVELFIPLRDPKGTPTTYFGAPDPSDKSNWFVPASANVVLRVIFPDVKFDPSQFKINDVLGHCVITVETVEFSETGKKPQFEEPCETLSVAGLGK
jgi:hypothetical protein